MKKMMKELMALAAFAVLAVLPATTWAALSNYHYAQLDLSVIGKEGGLVCATTSSTTPGSGFGVTSSSGSIKSASKSLLSQDITIYAHAQANEGWEFLGWFDNAEGSGSPISNDNPYKCTITASSTSSGSPTTKTLYAKFRDPSVKIPFSEITFKLNASSLDYTGSEQSVSISEVSYAGGDLTKDVDYTVDATSVFSAMGSALSNETYKVIINAVDGSDYVGSATNEWKIVAPSGEFAADALSTSAPGCELVDGVVKVSDSTTLEYVAENKWKANAIIKFPVDLPTISTKQDDPKVKYIDEDHALIEFEVGSVTKDIKNKQYRVLSSVAGDHNYIDTITWTVDIPLEDVKAAVEEKKAALEYEISVGALAWTHYTSGLKSTTYKIVVPIDENLVLYDDNGDEKYPNNHKHMWDLAAAGATLIATCTNKSTECSIDGGKIMLTLAAENQDYTGNKPTVTLEGKDNFDKYLKEVSYGTITYEKPMYSQGNDQWYTGDYTAKCEVTIDGVTYELKKDFKITKPDGGYTSGYEVSDISFKTTQEALDYAPDGGTVVCHSEIEGVTLDFKTDKDVTLNLNGKTLTGDNAMTIKNTGSGTVTLTGGTLKQPYCTNILNMGAKQVTIPEGKFVFADLTLENVATQSGNHFTVTVADGAKLKVTSGSYQAEIKGNEGDVEISGGSFGLHMLADYDLPAPDAKLLAQDRIIKSEKSGNTTTYTVVEHRHNYVYGAVDNVITAVCDAVNHEFCGFGSPKLTLTAENACETGFPYTGAKVETDADFPVKEVTILYYTKDDQSTPLGSAPSEVGEYVAKVTVGGATAEKAFAIIHIHEYVPSTPDAATLVETCGAAGACDAKCITCRIDVVSRDWEKGKTLEAKFTDGFGDLLEHTASDIIYKQGETVLTGAPKLTGSYTACVTVTVDSVDYELKKDFKITKPTEGYPNGYEINGIAYDTYAEAIAAAAAGDTIVVHDELGNQQVFEFTSEKDVTLDLDGQMLTYEVKKAVADTEIRNTGNGTVTLVNGIIYQPKGQKRPLAFWQDAYFNTTISGKFVFGEKLYVDEYQKNAAEANAAEANDLEANDDVYTLTADDLTITGGLYQCAFALADAGTRKIAITGGDFAVNPEAFLADGYALGKEKETGYPFHVFEHTHDFSFTAEGAGITCHCTVSGCYYDGVTAKLVVEDVMYDGKSHGATLDPAPGNGFPAGSVSLSYETEDGEKVDDTPSKVGSYWAIATASGDEKVTVKALYRITDGRPFDLSAIQVLGGEADGRVLERSTLTVTNGKALKYYTADKAPDGSGIAGWYVGMTVPWPNGKIVDGKITRLKAAIFRVGDTDYTGKDEIPRVTVSKSIEGLDTLFGSMFEDSFRYVTSFTWWERIVVDDVKTALSAGQVSILREVTARGEKWEQQILGDITYGDKEGVAETTFKIVVNLKDLELTDGTYTYWPEHEHEWSYVVDDHHSITATCSLAGCPYSVGVGAEFGPKTVAKRLGSPEPLEAEFHGIEMFIGATDATVGEIEYYQGETKLDAAPIEPGQYVAKVVLTLADGETTYEFMTTLEIEAGAIIVDGQHYALEDVPKFVEKSILEGFREDMYILVGKDFTAERAYKIPAPLLSTDFAGMATKYFDLNGFSITGAVDAAFFENKGKLVLSDSSEGQTGRMVTNPESAEDVPLIINKAGTAAGITVLTHGAELTIESGIYLGMISNEVGEVIEAGGLVIEDLSAKLVIKGGKFLYRPEKEWLDAGCYIVEETLDDGTPVFAVYPHVHEYKFVSLGSLVVGYCVTRDEGQGLLEPSSCQAKVVLMSALMQNRPYDAQAVKCEDGSLEVQMLDILLKLIAGKLDDVDVSGAYYVNLSAIFRSGFNFNELIDIFEGKTTAETIQEKINEFGKTIEGWIDQLRNRGQEQTIVVDENEGHLSRLEFETLTGATVDGPYWTTNASLIEEIIGGEDELLDGAPKDAGAYKVCYDILTPSANMVSVKNPFKITPLPIEEVKITTDPATNLFIYSGKERGYSSVKVYSSVDKGYLAEDFDYTLGGKTNATAAGDYFFKIIGTRNYEGVTNIHWSIIKPVRPFPTDALEATEEGDEPYGIVNGPTLSVVNAPAIEYSVDDQGWWVGYTFTWPREEGNKTLPEDANLTITYPDWDALDGKMVTYECTAADILAGEITLDWGGPFAEKSYRLSVDLDGDYVKSISWSVLFTPEDLYIAHDEGKLAELGFTIKAGCWSTDTNPEGLKETDFSLVVPLGNLELYDVNGYRVFPNHLHTWEFEQDARGWLLSAHCTSDPAKEGECELDGDPWMTLGRYLNEEIEYTGKPVKVRKMNEWEFRFATGAIVGEVEYFETNDLDHALSEAPFQVGTYAARVKVTPMARKDGAGNEPYVLERTFKIVKPLFGYTDGFEVKSTERRYDTYAEAVATLTADGDTIYCHEDIEKAEIDLTTPYDVTIDLCDKIVTADAEMTIKNDGVKKGTKNGTTVTLENGTVIQPRHYALKIIQLADQAEATGKFVFGRAFRLRNVALLPSKRFTVTIPVGSSLEVTGGSYTAKFEAETKMLHPDGKISIKGGLYGMNFKPADKQIADGYEIRNALGEFAYIVVEKGLTDEEFTKKLADSVVESVDNDVVRGKLADILAKSAINAQEIFNWIKEKIGDLRQDIQQDIADIINRLLNSDFLKAAFDLNTGLLDGQEVAIKDYTVAEDEITFRVTTGAGDAQEVVQTTAAKIAPYVQVTTSLAEAWKPVEVQDVRIDDNGLVHVAKPTDATAYIRVVLPKD